MEINKIQDKIIEEFSELEDWLDKYNHIIELGKSLPPMDDIDKIDENSISGCQSKLWLVGKVESNGKIIFTAESDALITKGIISLLLRVFNNRTPEEISNCDLYFVDAIGLSSSLSPSRGNGLASILNKIRFYERS